MRFRTLKSNTRFRCRSLFIAFNLALWALLFLGAQDLRAAQIKDIKVAIIQYAFQWPDEVSQDAARFEDMVWEAAAQGAQLIVGPENALHRYSPWEGNGVTELDLARQFDDIIRQFSALAAELNVCIVFGLREPSGDPQRPTYQSAVFIDNQGQLLKIYRKRVPSHAEAGYTKSGGNDWTAFETPFGRFFLQICKDMDDGSYAARIPADTDVLIGLNMDNTRGWAKVVAGCKTAGCYGVGANWSNITGSVGGNSGFVDSDGQVISEAGSGEKIIYQTLPLPVTDNWVTLLEDDFNRTNGSTVGNGWTEVEASGAVVALRNGALYFTDTSDVVNRPLVKHEFQEVLTGTVEWELDFNWTRNKPEKSYALYLQLGNGRQMSDGSQDAGVGVNLVWTIVDGFHQHLASQAGGALQDLGEIHGPVHLTVTADLAAGTYDVRAGFVTLGSGLPFDKDVGLNAVRIFTDRLNEANFTGRLFDNLAIRWTE